MIHYLLIKLKYFVLWNYSQVISLCGSFVPLDSVSAGSHHLVIDPAPRLAAFVACLIQDAEQVVLVVSSFLARLKLGPIPHPC